MRRFLTVPEVAVQLGTSPGAVRQRIRRGQIPHVKLGRSILIPRDALRQLPVVWGGGR